MTKATVLFADNDPDFLSTRSQFLEQEGYTVVKTSDSAEARRILDQDVIDVAILDLRLVDDDDEKDISGLALAKVEAYARIPKIILTGFPSYLAVREALTPSSMGVTSAEDFLGKEEGSDALLAAVERILTQSSEPALLQSAGKWLIPLLIFGTVLTGVLGIISNDPRWLIGTAACGVLFAVFQGVTRN